MTNKEIGGRLSITEDTVKKHVQNIIWKLRAADRTQAAIMALKLGLLENPALSVRLRGPERPRRAWRKSTGFRWLLATESVFTLSGIAPKRSSRVAVARSYVTQMATNDLLPTALVATGTAPAAIPQLAPAQVARSGIASPSRPVPTCPSRGRTG
jgi:hypothetical protein